MSTPTPMPTVELDRADLHRLLRPVLPFAGTDDMLPVLQTVRLDVHGDHLYATATNRFRAAMHRVPAYPLHAAGDKGHEERAKLLERARGFSALVTTSDLRAIGNVWPAGRRGSWTPTLELAATPNDHNARIGSRPALPGLTVRDAATRRDRTTGPRVTYEAAHLDAEYPRITHIFRQAIDEAGKPSEHGITGMSSEHFAVTIAAAGTTVSHGETVVMRNIDEKMTAVYGSLDFVAIVMQRRLLDPAEKLPRAPQLARERDALEAWKAYLDGTPAAALGS